MANPVIALLVAAVLGGAAAALFWPVRGVYWHSLGDVRTRGRHLESPIVQRCIEDYLVGNRQPGDVLNRLAPFQQNVTAIIANACLV